MPLAGAHDGAVRADELLLGAAKPGKSGFMLHTELLFTRGVPGPDVDGGRRVGIPRLLLLLHTAVQHGGYGQLTVHTPGFYSLLRVGGRGQVYVRSELLRHDTETQQVHLLEQRAYLQDSAVIQV